ncbi:MAG: DUF6273 domain-containing protein, partial [Holophagaceae bacterium]|nr:DUF6273 domain-containing protein [Holophagaceae bacterium]
TNSRPVTPAVETHDTTRTNESTPDTARTIEPRRDNTGIIEPRQETIAQKIIRGDKRDLKFGNFKWRVLVSIHSRATGKVTALLITEDIIEERPFHHYTTEAVTWEKCDLRKYLNKDFLQKNFNDSEREQMNVTTNKNRYNAEYKIIGEGDTDDKVFLLSYEQARDYFSGNADRVATLNNNNNECRWWLRSLVDPGFVRESAALVGSDGVLGNIAGSVHSSFGIRPAIWINPK